MNITDFSTNHIKINYNMKNFGTIKFSTFVFVVILILALLSVGQSRAPIDSKHLQNVKTEIQNDSTTN